MTSEEEITGDEETVEIPKGYYEQLIEQGQQALRAREALRIRPYEESIAHLGHQAEEIKATKKSETLIGVTPSRPKHGRRVGENKNQPENLPPLEEMRGFLSDISNKTSIELLHESRERDEESTSRLKD